MKPDIHPNYRLVVFRDISCDFEFLTKSTIAAKDTTEVDGVEYPLITVDISSQSHPFYTGTQKILDTAGRVEKFYRKYGFARPEDAEGDEEVVIPERLVEADALPEPPSAEEQAERAEERAEDAAEEQAE